jgi:hypothetical protein
LPNRSYEWEIIFITTFSDSGGGCMRSPQVVFAISYRMISYRFITEKDIFIFNGDIITLFQKKMVKKEGIY